MTMLFRIGLAMALVAFVGCSESEQTPVAEPATQTAAQTPTSTPTPGDSQTAKPEAPAEPAENESAGLAKRGRAVYSVNCVACHSPDPSQDGGIGPAIAGASLALLEARIMRNEYPEGYTPKRDTRAMIPLPYLKKDLAALEAYLAN